jgi:hypothetical protein
MRSRPWLMLALFLAACGGESRPAGYQALSKEPISVRGWIADIDANLPSTRFRTVETEAARRAAAFQAANVWIDNAPYVSGGIAENGAFVLLDVPPGKVRIAFSAPGAPEAVLPLENVPPNADVVIGGLVLKSDGTVTADAAQIKIRIPGSVAREMPTAQKATVAGIVVPIVRVPINSLQDRHDYPNPPSTLQPLATVK